jgi:hypothetical protein
VAVTAACTLRFGRLEPRRADPAEDQRSATHSPDKPKNFSGLTRESLPELWPR